MGFFRDAARWIFCAALVYAPWAYGGTTSTSIQIINWLLLAAFILWGVELIVSRRKPRFPRVLLLLILALIGIGGWMAINSGSIYDTDFYAFVPLRNFAPRLAGSVDYAISAAGMVRGTLLLRAIWISVFVLTVAAVLANTSRVAQLVALLLMVAICLQFGPALLRKLSRAEKSAVFAGGIAILLTLIALAQATHLEQPFTRWQSLGERIPTDARWH